jgi:hypothetical protein
VLTHVKEKLHFVGIENADIRGKLANHDADLGNEREKVWELAGRALPFFSIYCYWLSICMWHQVTGCASFAAIGNSFPGADSLLSRGATAQVRKAKKEREMLRTENLHIKQNQVGPNRAQDQHHSQTCLARPRRPSALAGVF